MASHFTGAEWQKINTLYQQSAEDFDLPKRRNDSVIIGSFNIRKLGGIGKRTQQSWNFLKNTIERFDLIAVQEIMDDLSGFHHLLNLIGDDYGIVVSDVTGAKPGKGGNKERLGYIFNWKRIQRTALASDITFDRSEIAANLYNNRTAFSKAWKEHTKKLKTWEEKVEEKKLLGKRGPSKPPIELPEFVSFIRQPHCVSFRIKGAANAKPYEFLVVNAHLLYGKNKHERKWEFQALLEWLTIRAKYVDKLYHPNIMLLGDCNLDFDNIPTMREEIDAFLKGLNKSVLKSKKAADANFPLLTKHPDPSKGFLKTALRQKQTYDQIGIFSNDPRLPTPDDNDVAGDVAGGYDYGVFNLANLVAQALHSKNIDEVTTKQRKAIYKKAEFDISDHMPIWMRLAIPN
jgi:endonuclease/exonuclease/phosphatase family metal-dependent hydrolase